MSTIRLLATLIAFLLPAGSGTGGPALKTGSEPTPDSPVARFGSDRFRAAGRVAALAFSPDGGRLASLAENGMSIWDAANGREFRFVNWRYAHPRMLTWPGKGQPMAVLDPANDSVFLWAFADGKAIVPPTALGVVSDDQGAEGRSARFSHVAISSDGARVAAADGNAKNTSPVRVWETAPGKRLNELTPLQSISVGEAGWTDFGFSPDGRALLVFGSSTKAGRSQLTLFDSETGKVQKRFTVPSPATNELGRQVFVVSSDGKLLILGRADTTTVVVDLTGVGDPLTLGESSKFEERDRVVTISPDGKWIATDLYGSVIVWDVEGRRLSRALKQARGLVTAVAFSPEGKRLACANRSGLIQEWNVESWDQVVAPESHTADVAGVAVSPDGKTAVTAGSDKTLRFWDARSGVELRSVTRDESPESVHFTPDGKGVVVCERDPVRKYPKFGTRFARIDLSGHSEPVGGDLGAGLAETWPTSKVVGFSADGRTLMTRRLRTITFWDWPDGKKRRSIEVAYGGVPDEELTCRSASLSADGRLLAVSVDRERDAGGRNIREPGGTCILDAATGERLSKLEGPAIWYAWVAFTPDSKRVVVGGMGDSESDFLNDERISLGLFDAATGRLVRRFQLPEGAKDRRETEAIAVSRDGRAVMVGEKDHSVTVYEMATGLIRQQLTGHRSSLKELVAAPNGRLLSVAWNDPFALVWATSPAAATRRTSLTAAELGTEWDRLGKRDAKPAFRAMVRMASDPTATVEHLRRQLSSAKPVDSKAFDKVFTDLEAGVTEDREKAAQALDEFGRGAVRAARTRLEATKSEAAARLLERFIERQEREELNGGELRAIRAVELLESIGGEESRKVLEDVAKGSPSAWLTIEAFAALRRLQAKRE